MTSKTKEYLKNRNVTDKCVLDFISDSYTNPYEYKLFTVNGHDYMLSCFFDASGETGYDLIKTNEILNIDRPNMVAIAAVEGDDIVCINTTDNSFWLWLVDYGDDGWLKIANSFNDFISITFK